jgi:mxaL protein
LDPVTRYPVENVPPRVQELIVGVGGDTLVPIPKFNIEGNDLGVWSEDEVRQLSMPSSSAGNADEQMRAAAAQRLKSGAEHLSSLKEPHLRELASEAGLAYARLTTPESLLAALRRPELGRSRAVATDLRWGLAAIALLALTVAFAPTAQVQRLFHRG